MPERSTLGILYKIMHKKVDMSGISNILDNLCILGDPEVTANIYCKSRNLPNADTQNYSTDLR